MMPTSVPQRSHIGWIDYAKSIAIFLVVLIHTHCYYDLIVVLKGFTMPAFFFLSGFLFSRERNPEFKPFVAKRFRQLVVPYVWINIVAYLLWLVALRNYGNDAGAGIGWHEPLVAIALGIPPGLTHDIPLWSLLCFFLVEMLYFSLSGWLRLPDWAIALAAYAVASAISLLWPVEGIALPFAIVPAASGLAFYALGHLVRVKSFDRDRGLNWQSHSPLILLCGVVLLTLGFLLNTPVSFFVGAIGNPAWFVLSAVGGIIVTIEVALFLDRLMGDGGIIRLMARGTLLICGFHLLIFAAIKGVMFFGFGIEPSALTDGLLRGVCLSVLACLLCMPLIWVVERYFRFLVSK